MNSVYEKSLLVKKIGLEIKIGVVLMDLLMTLYVLWLIITDTSTWIVGALLGFTPFGAYELLRADKLFGFCIVHKLMIWHTVAVYCCCVFEAKVGFSDILPYARWTMFLSGVYLIYKLIKNNCYGNRGEKEVS